MIDNSNLVSALLTAINGIINYITSKPIRIIKMDYLIFVCIIINHIIQELGVVKD